MKTLLYFVGIVAIVAGGWYVLTMNSSIPEVVVEADDVEVVPVPASIENIITVASPLPGDSVNNPILISGEARGYWFFEASAPVVVTNWNGLIIGEGFVTAQGDWMTEDYVPFTGTISYDLPIDSYSATGTIIFMKDNPSGLLENDMALEYTIELQP